MAPVSHDCGCGRPIQDTAVVCPHCAHQLDAALAEIVDYRGLAYDLNITLSKQANTATANNTPQQEEPQSKEPGTLRPTPSPYHGGASRAAHELKAALVTWALIIRNDTGAELPGDTLAAVAAWLRPRVGWLRYHEAGGEAVDGICDAVAAARRCVDRPAEKLYAGPCDCGVDLYARLDASYVECRAETHEQPLVWPVVERRRWLLVSAEDVLATTTEISRALTRYQQPVTSSMLRGYVARKRLGVRGSRVVAGRRDPVPLYRLGDVLDILAQQAEKVAS
jgi:hypothetical protein